VFLFGWRSTEGGEPLIGKPPASWGFELARGASTTSDRTPAPPDLRQIGLGRCGLARSQRLLILVAAIP